MLRSLVITLLAAVLAVASGAQESAAPDTDTEAAADTPDSESGSKTAPPSDPGPGAVIAGLTLEQKISQMHIIGFPGDSLDAPMERLITDDCLGGVFLQVGENFMFPENCAGLAHTVQEAAVNSPHGIPLFIALDQEGGLNAPIHYMFGATPTPGNMALGASGRGDDAYAAYRALGGAMRACGANLNFAPAIDVMRARANPDYGMRSFGADTPRNALLGAAAVRGLHDAGVLATAKHFPGIVTYEEDPHAALPHITLDKDALSGDALAHWRAVIDAGTPAIMTVHAVVSAWDAEKPVTLSPAALGVLREDLGYDGLIVSDSMTMDAITKATSGPGEATVQAILAGCDVILQVGRSIDGLQERIRAVVSAVHTHRIDEARIDASLRRILAAKDAYPLAETPADNTPEAVAARLDDPALAGENEAAALHGVVVVRDSADLLPLGNDMGEELLVVCPPSSLVRPGKSGAAIPAGYPLSHYVRQRVPAARTVFVDPMPSNAQIHQALDAAKNAGRIVLGQALAHQAPAQVAFIRQMLDLGKPTIVVGLGLPSELMLFPDATTFIAAHGPAPINCAAATKVLFGEAEAGGTLPMPIPGLYPIGHPAPPEKEGTEEAGVEPEDTAPKADAA